MNACADPDIDEVTTLKSVQIGGSEGSRNVLGYWIDRDPGPTLIVLPNEDAAKEWLDERVKPLITSSPQLKRHMTSRSRDWRTTGIHLDTMPIYLAWSNSPSSLATRPCRYVIFDETDKYPPFAGKEADPIRLGTERTTTYRHRRKIIKVSTPTTRHGPIWQAWEDAGERFRYHVPCPHCGRMQALTFDHVKWPKAESGEGVIQHAERVQAEDLAWYQCRACEEAIRDDHRPTMLEGGNWVGDVQDDTKYRRVAFHINALYSPWKSFSDVAAEFLRSKGDVSALMNFRNSWLAEPFEQQVNATSLEVFQRKREGAPPAKIVPAWAGVLIASADTQMDRFYVTMRAWGHRYRSQLVWHGEVDSFDALRRVCLDSEWTMEGREAPVNPSLMLIDSGGGTRTDFDGNRTDEVYRFARTDPRIRAIKGASTPQFSPIKYRRVTYTPQDPKRAPYNVSLAMLDVGHFKDLLAHRIHAESEDAGEWLLNDAVDEDYCAQLSSEHKIVVKRSRSGIEMRWMPKTDGSDNHYWDCEVYQCAGAEMAKIDLMPSQADDEQAELAAQRARATRRQPQAMTNQFGQPWLATQR